MSHVYKIRDWDLHFEVAQGRKVEKAQWVPLPVKHDGLGFRRLMGMTGGVELYGAWVLIVQVAAKCPLRGTLADERGPLTSEALAFKTGCPQVLFDKAFKTLSGNEIGWIFKDEYQPDTSRLPLQDRTGQDITKQDKKESAAGACPPALKNWIDWWNALHSSSLVAASVACAPPSKAVLKGWSRVQKDAGLRAVLKERAKIEQAIRDSEFVHKAGWFRLEKLFGGTNRDGELIVKKLLEGGFNDADRKQDSRPMLEPFA